MQTFRKQGSPDAIASEVASLRWLTVADGAPVVELVATGKAWLETRLMREQPATKTAAYEFGARLAHTHAAGADWWGQAPPGVATLTLAHLPMPTVDAPRLRSFGEFFATMRLLPYFRMADAFDDGERQLVGRAIDVVASGACDSPQPALTTSQAARVHGDLWGGNVLWAPEGILIDPAAHGGHAETDLASLGVFGAPHLESIVQGYDHASTLAEGWRDRIAAHQLHMWLTHVALFGSSYVAAAIRASQSVIRRFGSGHL